MSDIAVKVEGLGKKYVIGHQKSGDLRNSFGDKIKSLLGKNGTSEKEEFWALQDINFEIKKGEAVGIIGRNGAGKSTLLKILSRITEPTKGRFEINGRVSSLLEVGTGFHMELTGRENIYLNGTILGMKRREIKAKFDEIVAFSGVERFIDTPVKHYSSGMKVRLAFSVAAHLEPEILIIDEVLAVGDAEFQKKCLGKMEDVSKNEGRTVIFVSHNLGAVKSLCHRGILLDSGSMKGFSNTESAISDYLKIGFEPKDKKDEIFLNKDVLLRNLHISKDQIKFDEQFDLSFTLCSSANNPISGLAILFYDSLNQRIAIIDLRKRELKVNSEFSNQLSFSITVEQCRFVEGSYHLGVYLSSALCTGDFYNLAGFDVGIASKEVAPYDLKYRGFVELKYKVNQILC